MSENTSIAEVEKLSQEKELQLQKDMADHFMKTIQNRVMIAEKAHEMGKKVIIVDIDGTICRQVGNPGESVDANEFTNAEPFPKRIEYLNSLHDEGHYIHYWTARGCWHGNDTLKETKEQLDSFKSICFIGHEPNFSMFISRTCTISPIRFTTANMAKINFKVDSWKNLRFNEGLLAWHQRPKELNH